MSTGKSGGKLSQKRNMNQMFRPIATILSHKQMKLCYRPKCERYYLRPFFCHTWLRLMMFIIIVVFYFQSKLVAGTPYKARTSISSTLTK